MRFTQTTARHLQAITTTTLNDIQAQSRGEKNGKEIKIGL